MRGISRRATGASIVALVVALVGAAALPALTTAQAPANEAFQQSWERTDRPVSELIVSRTWIWGPEPITEGMMEPYVNAEGGERLVQYFDKSRMELNTDPNVDQSSPWYVINGLLATELITGQLQLGDDTFEQREPAEINIAGDATDPNAPTYATFNGLMDLQTFEPGSVIGATVNRAGVVDQNPALLEYGVTADVFVEETQHSVASVFWQFMTSEGTIYENGQLTWGALFQDAFFATGLPVTEAYWTSVEVGGVQRDVLVQAFERRVLTYTPDNPEGWRVESGNVGRHYYEWRYEPDTVVDPPATPTTPPEPTQPPATPEPTEPPDTLPEPDRGTIGTAGKVPLGEDEISPLAEPYWNVPYSPEMGNAVLGSGPEAKLNWQKSYLPYISHTPSGSVYFVFDFNDGSVYVSPVVDDNVGFKFFHTWLGRGEFHLKAWAIDPITGVRSAVTHQTVIVE